MNNWVRAQAEQIRQNEDRIQKQRDWQLHKADVIPPKARRLWQRLMASLESDVHTFNEEFSECPTRQFEFVKVSLIVTIRRTYFPDVRLTVTLNETEQRIDFERVVTRRSDSEPTEKLGHFRLHLDEDDELYLMNGDSAVTCEEASQNLLKPIFSL